LPSILTVAVFVIAMSWDDLIITNMVNGSLQALRVPIYMPRIWFKAWVVSLGAILTIVTVIAMFISTILKTKGFKRLKRK
jgi:spermidine/putrescine transport system permease protein